MRRIRNNCHKHNQCDFSTSINPFCGEIKNALAGLIPSHFTPGKGWQVGKDRIATPLFTLFTKKVLHAIPPIQKKRITRKWGGIRI